MEPTIRVYQAIIPKDILKLLQEYRTTPGSPWSCNVIALLWQDRMTWVLLGTQNAGVLDSKETSSLQPHYGFIYWGAGS